MKNQRGFTLVEISIVLVIIGLLIGGILRGRTFIENAKIKNVIKTAESLTAAIYAYQDRYGFLPGDDPNAGTRWSGATNGNGNGLIDGTEYQYVANHLERAGLVSGSYPNNQYIKHKYNGNIIVTYGTVAGHPAGNYMNFTNLPGKAADALDRTLDDGVSNTGKVRSTTNYNDGTNEETLIPSTVFYF